MRWGSSNSRAALGLGLLVLVLLGATCENQDYSAPGQLRLEDAPVFTPEVVEILQPYRGINSLDYRITNSGDAESRFGLFAAVSYELTADDGEGTITVEKSTSRLTDPLAPGAAEAGRLFETELGLGTTVHVEFHCFGDGDASAERCSGLLDYTLLLRQVDCFSDSDCSSNQACDLTRGICVTAPTTGTGCRSVSAPVRELWPVLLALGLLVAAVSWRRR